MWSLNVRDAEPQVISNAQPQHLFLLSDSFLSGCYRNPSITKNLGGTWD